MTNQELYAYHRWANRRLFDVAAALGEDACGRAIGAHFSFPTLRRMLSHIYGADALWLSRWKGAALPAVPGAAIATMADLRAQWDVLEGEQRTFVEALGPAELGRDVHYKTTEGVAFHTPLGVLVQHVAVHAAHHRSEIATMLTMVSGSPPDTGLVTWYRITSGQAPT
ncbi:MAG: DinB family protein [Candidatus Rokuibacteriota bacterium]